MQSLAVSCLLALDLAHDVLEEGDGDLNDLGEKKCHVNKGVLTLGLLGCLILFGAARTRQRKPRSFDLHQFSNSQPCKSGGRARAQTKMSGKERRSILPEPCHNAGLCSVDLLPGSSAPEALDALRKEREKQDVASDREDGGQQHLSRVHRLWDHCRYIDAMVLLGRGRVAIEADVHRPRSWWGDR